MVVFSVAICTKNGKALLSRQFVDLPRVKVEGLLAAFPKLIGGSGSSASGGEASSSKQHTFVETETVRYVYLPFESLYLVLLTNKGSNIIEDLDTLRLLSEVLPEQCGGYGVSEESVASRAFELLFAIDEVIAAGGYREHVTPSQVRTNLEMESHEEKLAQMIKASKMAEAKEAAKRKAAELKEREREAKRALGGGPDGVSSRITGISSSSGGLGGYGGGSAYDGGAYGGASSRYGSASSDGAGSSSLAASSSSSAAASSAGADAGARRAGGMKLGSKAAKAGAAGGGAPGGGGLGGALADLIAEEGLRATDAGTEGGGGSSAAAAAQAAASAAAAASADQATITLEERLVVTLTRDGGCAGMEVRGMLNLVCHDEGAARVRLALSRGDGAAAFAFQTHPNLNKALWTSDAVVALKQADRPFPVGAPVGVLRWRQQLKDTDGSEVPLALTVWPEETGPGTVSVNLEYNLQTPGLALRDVVITVPLPGGAAAEAPKVVASNVAPGVSATWRHNTRENVLTWHIDSITAASANGTLEFVLRGKGVNPDGFFPVSVGFASEDLLCPLDVGAVTHVDALDKGLRHSVTKALVVEAYTVE